MVAGDRAPAAAISPEKAKTAPLCMVWPGIWPKCSRTACMIHLCAQDGGLELGTACAAVGRISAAALGGGVSPVNGAQAVPGCVGSVLRPGSMGRVR